MKASTGSGMKPNSFEIMPEHRSESSRNRVHLAPDSPSEPRYNPMGYHTGAIWPRDPDEGPVVYPVACSPQAWAAASVFLFLQACLGLEISATRKAGVFHAASVTTLA